MLLGGCGSRGCLCFWEGLLPGGGVLPGGMCFQGVCFWEGASGGGGVLPGGVYPSMH